MDSFAHVSSQSLIDLQSNLRKLSEKLNETYETLKNNEADLGQSWLDDKFSEFEDDFKSSRELISELSEKYLYWANNYLPPYIELAIKYGDAKSGLGGR